MTPPILEMKNITKEFPGVKALNNVSFQVAEKEIHCLVGENGAGKSTLMKVLSGVYPHGSYTGDILLNGIEQQFSGIHDSEKAGIAIIYQELALVPQMTVYENIFLGHEIGNNSIIDWNESVKRATEMLKKVGLDINPSEKVKNLGVGKQQLIEIAKALSKDVKILILDEPTASLNETDSENLLNLLRDLKEARRYLRIGFPQAKGSKRNRRYGDGAARRPDDLHAERPQRRSVGKCAHQEHGRTGN